MDVAWDSLWRGVSLGASFLIAVLFWWPQRQRLLIVCGMALSASTMAFTLLNFAPLHAVAWLHSAFFILALTAPFWFWAVLQILLEDRSSLPPSVWALLGLIVFCSLGVQILESGSPPRTALAMMTRLMGLGLVVHAGWTVIEGRANDLVGGRIALRRSLFLGLCLAVTGFILVTVLLPLALSIKPTGTWQTILIAGFQLFACFLLLAPNLALVASAKPEIVAVSPEMKRLLAIMAEDLAWRDSALTLSGLSGKLAIPEYRLRALINQTLGYRNFPSFLNSYRLKAAAAALLAEPEQPILTIALDHGFGSIGPFNRAFRETFGKTPTQYRRDAG